MGWPKSIDPSWLRPCEQHLQAKASNPGAGLDTCRLARITRQLPIHWGSNSAVKFLCVPIFHEWISIWNSSWRVLECLPARYFVNHQILFNMKNDWCMNSLNRLDSVNAPFAPISTYYDPSIEIYGWPANWHQFPFDHKSCELFYLPARQWISIFHDN